MNARSAAAVAALIAVALTVGGCSGGNTPDQPAGGPATSATASAADTAKPVGVIAIGHSGLTGENSDPNNPGQVALENSWATGTSSQVNSIYRRLIAVRPETDGHIANTAEGGAPASRLAAQAQRALEAVPTPALLVVQTIDNDIRCDGTDDEHVTEFGVALADALRVVTTASPNSRILVVGQLGRPPSSVRCDPDPSDTLISVIEKYETEQARVCATVPHCRTDDGARAAYADRPENFSSDGNHLNVRGLAKAAEITWPAVAALLELP
jgi:lysophospholipase L1-like esterase